MLLALVLGLCAAGPALVGVHPAKAVTALLTGAFGQPGNMKETMFAWSGTLVRACPILLTGLSVSWAFRAGLFNIGAEGQLLWGALAAAWFGAAAPLPPAIHLPLTLAIGALAGALWAWPAALLKQRRGAPEVVTTLLLSLVAEHLTTFLANHPLHDPTQQGPRTADMLSSSFLPTIAGSRLHAGILLSVLIILFADLALRRSRLGFALRVVGLNPSAGKSVGLNVGRSWSFALVTSGALAGLAGAVEVSGVHHYFLAHFSPGYGYEGIAVAVLGGSSTWGVLLAGLFWGGLANGAVELELSAGVSRHLVGMIQALVILLVAVKRWPDLRPRRRAA